MTPLERAAQTFAEAAAARAELEETYGMGWIDPISGGFRYRSDKQAKRIVDQAAG